MQIAVRDDEPVAERVGRVSAAVHAQAGHDLVVLPELWPVGGFAYQRWAERAETLDGPTVTALRAAAQDAEVVLHAGSFVERAAVAGAGAGHGRWNTSVLIGPDGEILATYRKMHLFGFADGEPALLDPGEQVVTVDIPRPASGGTPVRVGLATCYDLRFPELYRALVDGGAQVLLTCAAWPAARVAHWTLLSQARAVENQSFVVGCNATGNDSSHPMGGRSLVVNPTGEVLALAPADAEHVLSVGLDVDGLSGLRARFPVLADRRL